MADFVTVAVGGRAMSDDELVRLKRAMRDAASARVPSDIDAANLLRLAAREIELLQSRPARDTLLQIRELIRLALDCGAHGTPPRQARAEARIQQFESVPHAIDFIRQIDKWIGDALDAAECPETPRARVAPMRQD